MAKTQKLSIWDPKIVRAALDRRRSQAESAQDDEESGDVRGGSRQRADDACCWSATSLTGASGIGFKLQITLWLWFTVLFANFAEAMAEGRGKAQADTLRKARDRDGARTGRRRDGKTEDGAGARRCARATWSSSGRRVHPGRRRNHRRRRVGGRIGDHRRIRAGDPRSRRRPLGGHRRHARAVGLRSRCEITSNPGETFLDRMIALVEGAERQKTPNEIALNILLAGLDDRLPAGGGHAAAVRHLFRRAAVGVRAGVAAGLPDSDDDRRAAVGHRHRRHGPADAAQRAGDVGPRGRGGGRREHAAARQDRHDHAGQSPGDASSSRCRASPKRELADAAQLSSLADETPEGRSIVVLAKEKYGLRGRELARARRRLHAVHRADAHVGRRPRRPRDPQGRGRRDREIRRRATAARCSPELHAHRRAHRPRRRHAAGGGRATTARSA